MSDEECPACGFDDSIHVVVYWDCALTKSSPSGNSIGSSGRGRNGWKYRQERKACALARFGWIWGGEPTQATRKRRLWITRQWGKGKRAYDMDNLAWGLKPLIDEIKVQGWIKEDSPKWVERIYKQEKSPDGVDRIIIRIEELEDE
jgi:hypothetical protein